MAAQTLDQVLSSLNSVYQPQINSVANQRALIPQQLQADQSALQGQQSQAFNDIVNGARSRGTGVAFGGIPLGEQAQYTATTFLPAMANLRNTYATKDLSLQDALNQINQQRSNSAQNIYQFGQQQDLAERQFNYQQANDAANRAAAERASAAQAAAFNPSLGASTAPAAPPPAAPNPYAKVNSAQAQSAIGALLKSNNPALINQTYNAIKKSAAYGNVYDQYKMQLLNSILHPPNNVPGNSSLSKLLQNAINYKPIASKPTSSRAPTAVPLGGLSVFNPLAVR